MSESKSLQIAKIIIDAYEKHGIKTDKASICDMIYMLPDDAKSIVIKAIGKEIITNIKSKIQA